MALGFDFVRNTNAIAYLFPGQGSQSVGMGQELAAVYPAAKAAFEEADEVLGFALSDLCFHGPEETLTDTINAQPALLTMSVALMRALQSELGDRPLAKIAGGAPALAAGHSMGEYTALTAVGALTFADGLRLVRERGRLMKAAGEQMPGMMAAVLGLDEDRVSAVCAEATAGKGIAQVANDNCPGQVVISGDRAGMEAAMRALEAAGARKIVPLAVSIAAHSPLMEPAKEALAAAIEQTSIHPPQIPIIGNTTAEILDSVDAIRAELTAQLTGGVRWTSSMRRALETGITDFVEIGPGDALTGMMKRIDRAANRHSVGDVEGVRGFATWLAARA